jgi:hypothetical protein
VALALAASARHASRAAERQDAGDGKAARVMAILINAIARQLAAARGDASHLTAHCGVVASMAVGILSMSVSNSSLVRSAVCTAFLMSRSVEPPPSPSRAGRAAYPSPLTPTRSA